LAVKRNAAEQASTQENMNVAKRSIINGYMVGDDGLEPPTSSV
jgi:hypothetical protein